MKELWKIEIDGHEMLNFTETMAEAVAESKEFMKSNPDLKDLDAEKVNYAGIVTHITDDVKKTILEPFF